MFSSGEGSNRKEKRSYSLSFSGIKLNSVTLIILALIASFTMLHALDLVTSRGRNITSPIFSTESDHGIPQHEQPESPINSRANNSPTPDPITYNYEALKRRHNMDNIQPKIDDEIMNQYMIIDNYVNIPLNMNTCDQNTSFLSASVPSIKKTYIFEYAISMAVNRKGNKFLRPVARMTISRFIRLGLNKLTEPLQLTNIQCLQ